MPLFTTALNLWFETHPEISQRAFSQESSIAGPDLSKIRLEKKAITFAALGKLLPAIEKLSDRSQARSLLVAYLNDETPPDYSADVRVYAVDEITGTVERDIIAAMRDRWDARARSDATFAAWWLTSDGYMHEADTDAVDARAMKYQRDQQTDDIALVAEDPPHQSQIRTALRHSSYGWPVAFE